MSAPRVLTLVGTRDGSSMWRCWQPARELQRRGYFVQWAWNDPEAMGLPATGPDAQPPLEIAVLPFDAVVFARLSAHEGVLHLMAQQVALLHKLGKAVFYEVDDDMFLHAREHLTDEADRERLAGIERVIHTVRLCDGITVSSRRLRTVARYALGDTIPVAYVPNLIDLEWWRSVQRRARRFVHGLTIGWAGAKRQDADLVAMAEGWRRVAARFPDVRFVVQGHAPPVITEAVPADRLTVLAWADLEDYPAGLVNIDIGCCSVADTPFNWCKTPIKAFEYAASGAAVVATTALYGEVVRHNDTGLIADTADAWEAGLGHLVADADHRAVLAGRLRRRVAADWALSAHAEKWTDAWGELLAAYRARARKVEVWTGPTSKRIA
jgi:glycosyltransferase involved in cell wall biosynthesis